MATGQKLADAYVELRADDARARPEVRVKAQRMGREFGGALNNQLRRLNLDPIDMKADPRSALAAIETTRERLSELSRDAPTIEAKVRTQQAINQLDRLVRQFGDRGVDAGARLAKGTEDGFQGQATRLAARINDTLGGFDLDPIDLNADPRQALDAIEETQRKLDELSSNAATVDVRIRAESARADLDKLSRQIGDMGNRGGSGLAASFAARIGPLIASAPVSPALLAAAVPAMPLIGGAVAGAVVGAAGAGGVLGGVAIASRHPAVRVAGMSLGNTLLADLERRGARFVGPVLEGIERIRYGWIQIGPDLDRIFESSRFVEPLVEGMVQGGRRAVRGFADAVQAADPVIYAISNLFQQLGAAVGDVFSMLADDARAGASALNDVTIALTSMVRTVGYLVNGLAEVRGWLDVFDNQLDTMRFNLEKNIGAMFGLKDGVDLTADGFQRGSKEAQALEKAVRGTATAADFATLKQAGMNDAQIAAADSTGKYRAEVDKATQVSAAATRAGEAYKRATEGLADASDFAALKTAGLKDEQIAEIDTSGRYKKQTEATAESIVKMAEKQRIATRAAQGHRDALDDLSDEMRAQTDPVFALRNAQDKLKEAQDNASAAIRKHGINSREARAATRELTTAAIDLQGRAGALGSTFSGSLTPQLYATLRAAGLTEKQINGVEGEFKDAKRAADAYSGKYAAAVRVDGMATARSSLDSLLIQQQALKKGISVSAARAAFNKNAYHSGGYTGPGGKFEPAGVVHRDEFVIRKEARRKIEEREPGLLDEMNATGQVRPRAGYAAGGLVRWPFPVTAAMTRIPSLTEALSVVTPQFSAWPSSPAAQRGDSGVWRKVVALIKSGPKMGSFGNAYRPGDPKWHGSGRAVDWMGYNMDALAQFLASKRPLELIHRTNRRDYAYTRGVNKGSFNRALMEAHRNHIHIAMHGGGRVPSCPGCDSAGSLPPIRQYAKADTGAVTLAPGLNLVENGTGKPEPLTAATTRLHADDLMALGTIVAKAVIAGLQGAQRERMQLSRTMGRRA